VITLPELVALLYQADWKRLSLLARISWARDREADRQFRQRSESDLQRRTWTAVSRLTGMPVPAEPSPAELEQECRVLLAPGGRFRVEAVADGTVAAVGDGERRWVLIADRALRRPGEGPGAALHGLVTPQWLLARYDLRVTGQAEVAGRPAHQVTGTPRRVSRQLADNFDRRTGLTCWWTPRSASSCAASWSSAAGSSSGHSCTIWNSTRPRRPTRCCLPCRRMYATSTGPTTPTTPSRAGAAGRRPAGPGARRRPVAGRRRPGQPAAPDRAAAAGVHR
jgi:hypothetical protein